MIKPLYGVAKKRTSTDLDTIRSNEYPSTQDQFISSEEVKQSKEIKSIKDEENAATDEAEVDYKLTL